MSLPRPGIDRADRDLPPQWRKPAIVVGLVLIAGVLGLTVMHRSGGSGPVAVAAPEVSPTDVAQPFSWAAQIADLESARAGVFAHPQLSLGDIDRPGSVAFGRDDGLRTYLQEHSLHAEGMSFQIESARQLTRTVTQATVTVIDTRSAYVLEDSHGKVVSHVAARPRHSWRVSLRFDQGAWRFTDVS